MTDSNIIIDLGEWKVPKSWNEITLKQFSEIQKYYKDKENSVDVREILHILANRTIDEVNELPIEFSEKLLDNLRFIQEEPNIGEPINYIEINGERYQVNIQEKLKTGEYISVNQILKDDESNLPLILAIMCRKPNEPYDSHFENEVIQDRVRLFDNAPMVDAMRIVNFFLASYLASETPTLLSSQIREEIDLIRKDIETSHQNGEVTKRYMKSVMKTLKKLEDTINSI